MRRLTISAALAGAVVLIVAHSTAQTAPPLAFTFDVVTIKPNESGNQDTSIRRPPSGIVATNAPLASLS